MKKNKIKEFDGLTVGIMFPVSIGVGLTIGYLFDRLFKTESIFMIIFAIYGIAAAFVNLFKHAKTDNKNEK